MVGPSVASVALGTSRHAGVDVLDVTLRGRRRRRRERRAFLLFRFLTSD